MLWVKGKARSSATTERSHVQRAFEGRRASWNAGTVNLVFSELRVHAPFTLIGTLTGVAVMLMLVLTGAPQLFSARLFWIAHPLHILLSALATTAMYRLHGRRQLASTIAIGYIGSIVIATLSDCIIPYLGEYLLGLPKRGIHLGFIEKWWLVNPLALTGISIGCAWPRTKIPHAGHVLLSTWASLFHMTMAFHGDVGATTLIVIPAFLFMAVWIPCCTSDIVFPLLFSEERNYEANRR